MTEDSETRDFLCHNGRLSELHPHPLKLDAEYRLDHPVFLINL